MKILLIGLMFVVSFYGNVFAKDCTMTINKDLGARHLRVLSKKFDLVENYGKYKVDVEIYPMSGILAKVIINDNEGNYYASASGWDNGAWAFGGAARAAKRAMKYIPSCK